MVRHDSSHGPTKRAIRRAALARVEEPVVIETHAGLGTMRDSVYKDVPGILCERNERRCEALTARFPMLAVYVGDSLRALGADLWPHANVIDIDAYGDPWLHVRAAMHAPWLPQHSVFVVTCGLIKLARIHSGWRSVSLQPAAAVLGPGMFAAWHETQAILVAHAAEEAGATATTFAHRVFDSVAYIGFELRRPRAPNHVPEFVTRRSAKRVNPYYRSKSWERLRVKRLALDRGVCATCGARGATHVHHVIERAAGGGDTLENLKSLCHACHSRWHASLRRTV